MGCRVDTARKGIRHPALFFEGTPGIYQPNEREDVLRNFISYLRSFYSQQGFTVTPFPRFQKTSERGKLRRYYPVTDRNGNVATEVVIEDIIDLSQYLREDPGRDYGASLAVRPVARFVAYFNSKRDQEFVKNHLRKQGDYLDGRVTSFHDILSFKQRDMFHSYLGGQLTSARIAGNL